MSDGLSLDHIKEDLWGALVIAKREFWSNLRSVRSLVMVIILALVMLGASMGFAGLSAQERAEQAFMYQLIASDPDGLPNDLVVYVYEVGSFRPAPDVEVELLVESELFPGYKGVTDGRGLFMAKNLTPAFHILSVDIEEDSASFGPGGVPQFQMGQTVNVYVPQVPRNVTVPGPVLGVLPVVVDLTDNDRLDDLAVQVLDPMGAPVPGASVAVAGRTNSTDPHGITTFVGMKKGEQNVTATSGVLFGASMVNVTHAETEVDPFAIALEGPDEVLNLVASIAIGLLGPIYAIVLCFDSIFRERISGSIDYLLCRPMGRRAVLAGKFVGILAALMVPITAVSMVGVAIISAKSDQAPTASVVVGFLFYTLLLIAIFTLLQMIFSTVAKTTGTAILSGVGLWIFFFMLFNIIVLLVSVAMDLEGQDAEMFFNRSAFLNPIGIYGLAMNELVTGSAGAGVADWAPGVAMVLITLVLALLTTEVFRRRVTE